MGKRDYDEKVSLGDMEPEELAQALVDTPANEELDREEFETTE